MALNSSFRENGAVVITSGDRLTIENAAEFARLLCEALQNTENVEIEFEPEVEIDLTALQTICSACKTAAAANRSFSYKGQRPDSLGSLISAGGAERSSVCKHNNDSTCIWFGGDK